MRAADRLREAAKLLREGAEAATGGEWRYTTDGVVWQQTTDNVPPVCEAEQVDDAAYIAAMHPDVGIALADILDGLAINLPEWEPGRRAADLILVTPADEDPQRTPKLHCGCESHVELTVLHELTALHEAVKRIQAIHRPIDAIHTPTGTTLQVCTDCGRDRDWQAWPCPTIQAIGGAS